MNSRARTPVAAYRARMAGRGLVRVEVTVRKEDAALVREVASALSDPDRRAAAGAVLRHSFGETRADGLKALLASAPFDDIDLDRVRDLGRDLDL